ncbi:MAG: proline racemase family protein [Planctomycetes bacterium]|nr:proline racemase family protein [Planctomycetota bacterium]
MHEITTIEAHTAGEPLRIVTAGYPAVPGATMLARRAHARQHLDHLRRLLMLEPRGHADMYGAVPMPPASDDGDVGVLFLHNEGYSTMCGHGIIALVKVGIEHGLFEADPANVRIDTPAGRVVASAELAGGRVRRVSFVNVPSFVDRELVVAVPGLGDVRCTIAYGGAFYAYVDAAPLGLRLAPAHVRELVDKGMAIKRAVAAACELRHPAGEPDLDFLYGTIFVAPQPGAHSRNVCVFADGEVDRSPTGTGVSGRAAIHRARGELGDDWITIESILGTSFDVRVAATTEVGGVMAVVPEVRGRAFVTGRASYVLDPDDPLADGFLIR